MKLEVGHIFINDIQFASESKIENGVLYVDEEAVKAIVLEDEKIKDVKFDIAKPGESVRITPVKDVIEPRVKFREWCIFCTRARHINDTFLESHDLTSCYNSHSF